jgi:hypothetical protein
MISSVRKEADHLLFDHTVCVPGTTQILVRLPGKKSFKRRYFLCHLLIGTVN